MTFCSRVVLLTVPAHMGSSAVGEAAGAQLVLDANFSALMIDGRELGATALAAGALLLLTIGSPALLALSSLLHCQILLQWGPQRKGAIDDLVVKMLTAETPASHVVLAAVASRVVTYSCWSNTLNGRLCTGTPMPELGIVAEHSAAQ